MSEKEMSVHDVQVTLVKQQDVIRIGTPGKGGSIDLHFDASDVDAAMKIVDNAKKILAYARKELE